MLQIQFLLVNELLLLGIEYINLTLPIVVARQLFRIFAKNGGIKYGATVLTDTFLRD